MIEARRIWLMDQQARRAHRLQKCTPFDEHILRGYKHRSPARTRFRLQDLSSECIEKKISLKSGAEAILLSRTGKASKILISLHGGPESYEGTEIRYLGLYRDLLNKGWAVAILNYRGSTGLKTPKKIAWKNWRNSILQDFAELHLKLGLRKKAVHLLGVSFGGALALTVSQVFKVSRCVLLSPLLDLKTQKQRAGTEYQKWFRSRFSLKDYSDFSFESLTEKIPSRTLAICSQQDEVLGTLMNRRLMEKSKANSSDFKVVFQKCGHSPKSYSPARKRYRLAFRFLTNS